MRRTSLVLAAAGATAALAVTGVALGANVADRPAPATAPVAVTAGPTSDDNPGPDDDATSAAPNGTADGAVSRQRAGEIALARTGGGRIVEIEAEVEHGRPVWSVKVDLNGIRHEVEVDRGDGTVVRTDDHGGDRDRTGTDDRYDDHGGDRSGGDD